MATSLKLGNGRTLPPLLFVTDKASLVHNVGQAAADQATDMVAAAGQELLDVTPSTAFASIQAKLGNKAGVVILGGYDVLPGECVDPVPDAIRQAMSAPPDAQLENLYVWSDRRYGERADGSFLPVSRVPDCHDAAALIGALTADDSAPATRRFGIRNRHRDYPDALFALLPGTEAMLVSAPVDVGALNSADVAADNAYVVLHGARGDQSRFAGETASGKLLLAMNVTSLPAAMRGVILSGVCYSALIVRATAGSHAPGVPFTYVPAANSIALTALARGARAFVGPTTIHLSEFGNTPLTFGGAMHRLFWTWLNAGDAPAVALLRAKGNRLAALRSGHYSPDSLAYCHFSIEQFTCLGLGW